MLEAEAGEVAPDILRANPEVDLLFTDLVMPGGMSGFDLVRLARELIPGLKVLLTTGYAAETDETIANIREPIPKKPYKKEKLTRALREALKTARCIGGCAVWQAPALSPADGAERLPPLHAIWTPRMAAVLRIVRDARRIEKRVLAGGRSEGMRDIESLPFTIAGLHEAYASGLTPGVVLQEVFRRIEAAADPGMFISLSGLEELQGQAARLPPFASAGMPFWGIPVAVKDNIDVAGLATTAACPEYSYRPEDDAEAVARLRSAGALIVGKTNLDQFATGLVGVRTPYPVPRNACDAALVPGGSSCGSAVAVAHGIVSAALGTDTAGSGRVPAALNNIVGLKPSLGAVSTRGVVPACRTLDCVSVFALTVEDAWTCFAAMAGYDENDSFSRTMAAPSFRARPPRFRAGVPSPGDRIFFEDGSAARAYDASLAALEALGAEIVPVPFQDFYTVAALLYEGAWVAERYAAIRELIESRPEALHPVTRTIIGAAAGLSASDAFEGLYRLKDLARRIEPIWSGIDVLCVPSIPSLCSLADVASDPIGSNARLGTYTSFVNLLDLAALAVPTAPRDDGRPNGVTLIGHAGSDGLLAGVGRDLHNAAGTRLGATQWRLERGSLPAEASTEVVELTARERTIRTRRR